MKFTNGQGSKRFCLFARSAFVQPTHFVMCWALGACIVRIGLLSPAALAAQSRWSGAATIGYAYGFNNFASDRNGRSGSVATYFRLSPASGLGLTLEYQGLGTRPFSRELFQEDLSVNILETDLCYRIRKTSGNIKPFAAIGLGACVLYWKNQLYSWPEVKPLLVLGIGIDFPRVLGAIGAIIQGRWRMIPVIVDEAGTTFGHLLSISIGITI